MVRKKINEKKNEQEALVEEDPQNFFFIDTPIGEIGGHVRQGFQIENCSQTTTKKINKHNIIFCFCRNQCPRK